MTKWLLEAQPAQPAAGYLSLSLSRALLGCTHWLTGLGPWDIRGTQSYSTGDLPHWLVGASNRMHHHPLPSILSSLLSVLLIAVRLP